MAAEPEILIRDFERVLRITIPAPRSTVRWVAVVFWSGAWLFGMTIFAVLLARLIDMTTIAMAGAVGTPVILLLLATMLLLVWIVVWVAGGIFLVYHSIFNACGVESHVITDERWTIERRIGRSRVAAAYGIDRIFDLRFASRTRAAGLVFSDGTPSKHRTVAFGTHAPNRLLRPVYEAIVARHPYFVSTTRTGGE